MFVKIIIMPLRQQSRRRSQRREDREQQQRKSRLSQRKSRQSVDREQQQQRKSQQSQRRRRNSRQQRGGDGQGNAGHDVSFPSEFYSGVSSGNYFPEGSAELGPYQTAYNTAKADGCGMFGNNIAPGSQAIPSSGIQTGGSRLSKMLKKARRVQVKDLQQNRRSSSKKRGGVWGELAGEASKLAVPLGLYAAKELAEKYLSKRSSRGSSASKSKSRSSA